MDFDLWAVTDEFVTRETFKPEVDNTHLWPSESSVKFYDSHGDMTTEGKCMRAAYFRSVGGFEKLPVPAYTQWIFSFGKLAEQMIIQKWKEMGIHAGSNIKFYDKEYNISGELDCVLDLSKYGGPHVICELKTAYGYYAEREIFGNKSLAPQPKMGHLLQLLVYLWKFQEQFPFGYLVYFFRDSMKRKTFKVSLHREGEIFYPVVDGRVWKTFTVNDILARYKELQYHIDNKIVPEMDFELQYSPAKIEDFRPKKLGGKDKISQTKYEAWQKGKLKPWEYVGDWQCALCEWRRVCYENVIDEPDKEHL